MINLRYHIVSITAAFLALGIGVALGSTFLDQATVDVLDRNIRSAEARIRATDAENTNLENEIDASRERDEALIATGTAELFDGQLTDTPVLIVTSQGVDAEVVAAVQSSLRSADADVRGTLELRDELDLADGAAEALAAAVQQDPTDPAAVRAAVFASLIDAFRGAGQPALVVSPITTPSTSTTIGAPAQATTTNPASSTSVPATSNPTASTTTTTPGTSGGEAPAPDGRQPAIISALIEADLVRFAPAPGLDADLPILEETGYRYVFVGGPGLDEVGPGLMASILPATAQQALPAVVVSASVPPATDGEDQANTIVTQIRDDEDRAALYSTVDDVDTFAGLTATVLVLRDLPTAETGHYGQAAGARAVLPGPS